MEKSNDLIRDRTCNLPACRIRGEEVRKVKRKNGVVSKSYVKGCFKVPSFAALLGVM
jgi:hypothetical protein